MNMAHKVHPKIFRAGFLENWSSRWFNTKNLANYLREDFLIRNFFEKYFKDTGIESIQIERVPGEIKVIINTSRPGLLIGRGGEGIEKIKKRLVKEVFNNELKKALKLEVIEVRDIWSKAALVAQWVARQLEKRIPYRRTIKEALERVTSSKGVEGAKIEVSGRLDGVEIARKEWLKEGKLPRQTLRANIDYAQDKAKTIYGIIGVKVWIYKGETF